MRALMLLQRVAMMLVGWGLFFEELVDAELRRWEWQNPLICCMIAGFVIVNWTRAGESFHDSVHDLSGRTARAKWPLGEVAPWQSGPLAKWPLGEVAPRQGPSSRLLRLLRVRLAAPGSSALPGRGPAIGIPATASGARASRLQSRRPRCV